MSPINGESPSRLTSLMKNDDLGKHAKVDDASDASVRKILWASATRPRNIAFVGSAYVSALLLFGFGMGWFASATLGLGSLVYASLISRDAVNENFLRKHLVLPESIDHLLALEPEEPLNLDEVEGSLRDAYKAVLARRNQLQEVLGAGPEFLSASLPEGHRICDSLLVSAQRLVKRGQRLQSYLQSTKLASLSDSAREAVIQEETTSDRKASRTYRMIVSGRQEQIETHVEVEGLYERVIAQLVLIETTLASTVAKIVKITAADDEESSLTASLVNEQLEHLVGTVKILETSIDEMSE